MSSRAPPSSGRLGTAHDWLYCLHVCLTTVDNDTRTHIGSERLLPEHTHIMIQHADICTSNSTHSGSPTHTLEALIPNRKSHVRVWRDAALHLFVHLQMSVRMRHVSDFSPGSSLLVRDQRSTLSSFGPVRAQLAPEPSRCIYHLLGHVQSK